MIALLIIVWGHCLIAARLLPELTLLHNSLSTPSLPPAPRCGWSERLRSLSELLRKQCRCGRENGSTIVSTTEGGCMA